MALTMVDPTSSWFELLELTIVTRLVTTKVNAQEKLIEEVIFDKLSDHINRLVVNKI